MLSEQPDGIPAAFRARTRSAAVFLGMTDEQVLCAAQNALNMAQALPVASSARAAKWSDFDDAMSELAGRGLRHILRKIREQRELPRVPVSSALRSGHETAQLRNGIQETSLAEIGYGVPDGLP